MTRTVNFQFLNGFYGRASIGHKLNEFGRIKLSTHPEKFCSTYGRSEQKYSLFRSQNRRFEILTFSW